MTGILHRMLFIGEWGVLRRMNIFVANMSQDVGKADLKKLFETYGEVAKAKKDRLLDREGFCLGRNRPNQMKMN